MTVYNFVLVRSGDGKHFPIGSGALEQGEALIKRMDAYFDAGGNPHEAYEGSDIYATLDKVPVYMYTDEWEDCFDTEPFNV